jgi:hypothetical protein
VTTAASLMVSHAIFTILPLRFEIDEFIQIRLSHRGTIFLSKVEQPALTATYTTVEQCAMT